MLLLFFLLLSVELFTYSLFLLLSVEYFTYSLFLLLSVELFTYSLFLLLSVEYFTYSLFLLLSVEYFTCSLFLLLSVEYFTYSLFLLLSTSRLSVTGLMNSSPLHQLNLGTLLEVYSHLDHRDMYLLGSSCRRLFMMFLRERESRKATSLSPGR